MSFRLALSISPFSPEMFAKGYTYTASGITAQSLKELQELYIAHGATEIFARVATKRFDDGQTGHHEREHTLERAISYARIAAELNIPFNPEIGVFRLYSDMEAQTAPDFHEYPEICVPNKEWNQLSLDEMCNILEQYGEVVAREILNTGCSVNIWDIGNETNFGFAGVEVGRDCIFNPKLKKSSKMKMYIRPHFGSKWLSKNVWPYNAKMMAAVAKGIRKVDKNARFSSHLAVVTDKVAAVRYFKCLSENGYKVDEAGFSLYPSAFGFGKDRVKKFKDIVRGINKNLGIPVFVAEFGYPSTPMTEGPYKGWSHKTRGYDLTAEGQRDMLKEVIEWGKENSVSGIRPWAPDFIETGWGPMAYFEKDSKISGGKLVMDMLREL